MSSSLSRPVADSMKPEPRPLIWTRQPVSCWMCLTYEPPWPTTCARRLKPGRGSRAIGIFSSGHLRYQEVRAETHIRHRAGRTYASELVSLDRRLVTTAESTLVDKLWELLLHELLDFGNSRLQSLLGRAGNMQIERGVLEKADQQRHGPSDDVESDLPQASPCFCRGSNYLGW